jgi:hypothetical protein
MTALQNPHSAASRPDIASPVNINSMARRMPTSQG